MAELQVTDSNLNKLDELALKYGTDKWGKHHYTPFYFDLFKDRCESVKKILEIGVGEGAGLRMWQDFFPNARIFGADNLQQRIFSESRIEVFLCDQSSEEDLANLIKKTGSDLDLVVDDGSHIPEHQVFSCLTLMPLLSQETVYIIEDVADPTIADKLKGYDCQVLKVGKRYDDRIIMARKS